jgi:hypothetical protein
MTRDSNEPDEIRKLAERHLTACETIYAIATARNDIDIAAHAARSALSVALNCTIKLGEESKRETAIIWHERLSELYRAVTPASDYLSRAVKWAIGATRYIYAPSENYGYAGIDEGT